MIVLKCYYGIVSKYVKWTDDSFEFFEASASLRR